ncbi:MAG TPA: hypothetical protein VMT20_06895 [Terriglobia bacterium]|nr:hypothetical protein [Terriglobia bacterium]
MTDQNHVEIGIMLLAGTAGFVARRFLYHPRSRLPFWGWVGLGIILLAELLLAARAVWWVSTFFTPIVWTGYILLADGLVASLKGQSRLSSSPRTFAALAFWSVPLWLVFEAYNLRLRNWVYVGMPSSSALDTFGYVWAFATIWPAIYETADLVEALGFFEVNHRPRAPSTPAHRALIALSGLILVAVPLLVPVRIGGYLFGAVWVGFVLLLDPLNYQWRGASLLRELEAGSHAKLGALLLAGWICGILWEFWNYWAGARWLYIFSIGQSWKIFQMPAPGFLGFPPFAVECWVMFEFLRTLKRQLGGTTQVWLTRRAAA